MLASRRALHFLSGPFPLVLLNSQPAIVQNKSFDNCSLMSDNARMQERITFRATTSLKAALKAEAKRDRRKLSNLVVLLLEEALKQRQTPKTEAA